MCYDFVKMYRLSVIINDLYLKYLPLAEKAGLTLNLDFADTTAKVKDAEKVRKEVEKSLQSAVKSSFKGEIKIAVGRGEISITDSGTVLSKPACALLSNERVTVKSKVGFGTTVKIKF